MIHIPAAGIWENRMNQYQILLKLNSQELMAVNKPIRRAKKKTGRPRKDKTFEEKLLVFLSKQKKNGK